MSILNKVGPLGEKVGRSLFGNVGEAVRSLTNKGGIGEALTTPGTGSRRDAPNGKRLQSAAYVKRL